MPCAMSLIGNPTPEGIRAFARAARERGAKIDTERLLRIADDLEARNRFSEGEFAAFRASLPDA